MKGYNYREFSPGTNIWRKPVRFFILSFERIGVLVGYFAITYLCLGQFFSYQMGYLKMSFLLVMFVLAIYSVLPPPSMPNCLLISEVFSRASKAIIKSAAFRESLKTSLVEQ